MALVAFGIAGLVGSAICSRFYRGHRWAFAVWAVAGVALALSRPAPAALWSRRRVRRMHAVGHRRIGHHRHQAEIIEFASDGEQTVAMAIFRHLQPRHRHGELHRRRSVQCSTPLPMWVFRPHRVSRLAVLRIRADQTYESPELKVGHENNCSKSIISI